MSCKMLVLLALLAAPAFATSNGVTAGANPIRKVVTMLQKMQKTVEAEGETEKKLFDQYMCYCKNGAASLQAGIDAAGTKIPETQSSIEEGEATLAQLKADVKQHQVDRDAAKTAIAEATALREKEAASHAAEKDEGETNLAACKKATVAIEQGMGSSFLQTAAAGVLRNLLTSSTLNIQDSDRETVTAFLAVDQSDEYAPASGEITGILKQMSDTMAADLKEQAAAEANSIKLFDELVAAQNKAIAAATAAIESKTTRIGELGVEIVGMKEDLDDTQQSLVEDTKFLADMAKNCKTKEAEWADRCALRQEELLALADTIKILNDDDALEMFKKTLPGSAASFVQVTTTASQMRSKALTILKTVKRSPVLDLILMAMNGKKVDFSKVLGLIDELVATLKTEQQDDDHKKEYCEGQFDVTEDKIKSLTRTLDQLSTAIDEHTTNIATLTSEVKALGEGIEALDKSVAEATVQRKEENTDFQDLMAGNAAAKEILGFAKNRLNKFYNPKLYKEPAASFVQISAHQQKDAPAAPPAADLSSGPKTEESNGVIGMIDELSAELTKEMTEAEAEEKDAQGDYEQFMGDSKDKRADDSKSIADKSSLKADLEGELEAAKESQVDKTKEMMATDKYMSSLHGECDWLINNYGIRRDARTGEIDSLTKAKAVLSGADFSLLQTARAALRR